MPIPQPPTALVGIPVALQALPVSSSKIALTAIYGATAVTNYTFQRATSPTGPWTTAVQQISPAFTDGGLNPSTTYYYQANVLTAETPSRTTQWSMVAQATTNPAAIVANKTFNPNTPAGTVGGVTNYQSLATACSSLVRGDHLEIQSPVVSSRLSPWIAKNAGNVAERINLLNISGIQAQPIIISVRVGDYVMLDMPLAKGTTSLPDNGAFPDPGQSLLHFENSNWILCDFRDQTQSTLLDFSQELDPTSNWALAIGNRSTWLSKVTNTTLPIAQRQFPYQHWATTNQINSTHLLICGAQVSGSGNFTASYMARNCSWIDVRYCDIGCHGINDQASGDVWPMQGDHVRVLDCYAAHGSHQNISFEGTNFITRRVRGNGGWADIATGIDGDTYAGGNISTCRIRKWNPIPFPVVGGLYTIPANFDPGSSLHEQNHYQNTGKSQTLSQGLPFLKLEGYAPVLRFCVFDNHRGAGVGYTIVGSSSEPISSNSPFDTSALVLHGRASMYHCVGHVINGIFLYEDSEFPTLWSAGKNYAAGQYVRNSSGFAYKAQSAGTSGPTQPTGTGTPSDGTITWTFLANHLLVNANHGFGNLIINNVFDQSSNPTSFDPFMLEFNLANSGAGRGSFPSNNKGFRVRNNLVNWTSGTTTFAQEFQFQCTGPSDIMLATTPSFYGGLIGNNRAYSPAFVNVAALSNNLCTVAIKGMILAPSNTDGLGTAEPLATVQNNVTLGTAITVDNVAPLFDGNGWADETPDTISILSASGTVKITVQIKAGSRSLAANTFSTAAPVTTVATDGIYVESPWSGLPLLNNGVG